MDSVNLILNQPVGPPVPLPGAGRLDEGISPADIENISDEKKKRIARDFESVLLSRLMDQMKETVGDWGLEQDLSAGQVQGIFWLHLAQEVSRNGGMGLWKDIYQFMAGGNQADAAGASADGRLRQTTPGL